MGDIMLIYIESLIYRSINTYLVDTNTFFCCSKCIKW